MRPLAVLALLAAVTLLGCGARTELRGCFADVECDDGVECTIDACEKGACVFSPVPSRCDDGVECTVDTCEADGCRFDPDDDACEDGVECTADTCGAEGCVFTPRDFDCDDFVECTVDACTAQGCVNEPDDALCATSTCDVVACDPVDGCLILSDGDTCDDGIACTFDLCDAEAGTCLHQPCDSLCTNGLFCDGIERCDTDVGCVPGPPACELGLACSADSCAEGQGACVHNASPGCLPPLSFVVAAADGALLSVPAFGGPTSVIAAPAAKIHYDIAILGGRWFVLDTGPPEVAELVPFTQEVKASYPVPGGNSLGAGPDGKLYAADTSVYRIDPDTGEWSFAAQLPPGYVSSGDISFLGERMFVSTGGPCGETLVEVDLAAGSAVPVGENGLGCVYGLVTVGDTLFTLDCSGKIGTFDPDTGVSQVLSTQPTSVYGADVLP